MDVKRDCALPGPPAARSNTNRFNGTMCSGMYIYRGTGQRRHYGQEDRLVKVSEPYQILGMIDEELKQAIGIYVEGVNHRMNMFGLPNGNWKEWYLDNVLVVIVLEIFIMSEDSQGTHFICPEGDRTIPPSVRMHEGGYIIDSMIRQEDFDEDELNPEDNLEDFRLLSDENLRFLIYSYEAAA
jgi:hypothetical protein